MNVPIPKMNCLKEITVLFAEKAERKQCRISQWATVGKCPGPAESRTRRGQIYEKNLTANFYKYVKL